MNAGLKPMAVPRHVLACYQHIKRAAAQNMLCPSNDELADMMDVESTSTVSRSITLLENLGLIKVRRFHAARQIFIIETDHSTADPGGEEKTFEAHKKSPQPSLHDRHTIDRFCEALAEIGTVSGAAREIGISEKHGTAIFQIVKSEMGAQAR